MKWRVITVRFDHPDPAMAAELIADCFSEAGIEGVVIDDPRLNPTEPWAEDRVDPPTSDAVTGYAVDDPDAAFSLDAFRADIRDLDERLGMTTEIDLGTIDEEDWAHAWKAFFWSERITARLVVKPTWRKLIAAPDDRVIEIDPGMAFGTGTHPTTRLCLQALERYVKPEETVLDVGTGSGILLAGAALFGAKNGLGVDTDSVAVSVAQDNLALNNVPADRFPITIGSIDSVADQFQLAVANILTPIILKILPSLDQRVIPGGIIITSGITEANGAVVSEAMGKLGLEILERVDREGWVVLIARRPF